MAYKVCVAWMISALALTISSAIASPISKKASLTLPTSIVSEAEDEAEAPAGEESEEAEESEEE